MEKQHYNLTFVGAGLSCCCTIIYYINLADELKRKCKMKLLVIEKTQEFWTGVPYGTRSGYDSLIITTLKEFLPDYELRLFVNWIRENFHSVVTRHETYNENSNIHEWLLNNQQQIRENLWESIFIPRYIFGIYLKERVTDLLDTAKKEGIIDCHLINAEVTDIVKYDGAYTIKARAGLGNEMLFSSTRVILSVGTPPRTRLDISFKKNRNKLPCLIECIYEPGVMANMSRVREVLERPGDGHPNNILILGSNASALEVLYNLKRLETAEKLINHIYVLSPDGAFPNKIKDNGNVTNYIPANLTSLKRAASYTSGQILEAVKKDTAIAHEANIDIADIYHGMSGLVIELLNDLNLHEQEKFVFNDGVEIGKFQRRAGAEYLASVDLFVSKNRISFIKGRFLKQIINKDRPCNFNFEYMDKLSQQIMVFPHPVKIVINCIGFQQLATTTSYLIKRLIERKICVPNGSGRGFVVNGNFQANDNFYIMGPLLAGNLNQRLRIWHAESCPRIFQLSRQLAEVLISD